MESSVVRFGHVEHDQFINHKYMTVSLRCTSVRLSACISINIKCDWKAVIKSFLWEWFRHCYLYKRIFRVKSDEVFCLPSERANIVGYNILAIIVSPPVVWPWAIPHPVDKLISLKCPLLPLKPEISLKLISVHFQGILFCWRSGLFYIFVAEWEFSYATTKTQSSTRAIPNTYRELRSIWFNFEHE